MSRAKCHRESYESGGSLGVVSRLVRMNKFYWSILLKDKQKAKCGGVDKSQIYMKFTFIYLVFCIVYHLVWTFWCVFSCYRWCSSKMIKEWTKDRKKEQKEPIFGYVQGHAAAWQGSMPQHVQISSPSQKIREEHAAAWLLHAAAYHVKAEKASFKACRSMPYPCRGMTTIISLVYFWQVGFNVLGFLL